MGKERKDKLNILMDIEATLTDYKGWAINQIAKEIKSNWLTIRECCDYLADKNIINRIRLQDGTYIYFKLRK